jgi:hypothetical protein
MTKQLEQALTALSQLPETEQDAIATLILEQITTKEISPPQLSPTEIESLEKFYSFRERTKVLQFIEKHPFLISPLLSIPDNVRNYIYDSQLSLEVLADPEINDYLQLFILISTQLDSNEAIDKLDKFEDDWWLQIPYEVRKLVAIDVECQ